MNENLYAALTGDLIASRAMPSERVDAAMVALNAAAIDLGEAWNTELSFTRNRGDGWQVLLTNPCYALHAMVYLRARLRAANLGLDTRVSAGIGQIANAGTADLSDATGQAFFISGDHLNLAKKRRMLIAGQGVGVWQNAVLLLTEQVMSGWSSAQAEAAAMSILSDVTQAKIADNLGITRQAVQSRLASSGVYSLDEALHAFATHDFEAGDEIP